MMFKLWFIEASFTSKNVVLDNVIMWRVKVYIKS